MAVPQPKLDELASRVNAETKKPRSEEFVLRKLEREIAPLLKASDGLVRVNALCLSGALEALRFDIDTAKVRFQSALAASGNASFVYANYAAMLTSIGHFTAAFEAIERAVEKSPDVETLQLAIHFASNAFAVERVRFYSEWLGRLKTLDGDPVVRKAIESVQWHEDILSRPNVTREGVLRRYELARSVALDRKLRIPGERASKFSLGVLVEWAASTTQEEVDQMNLDVAIKLGALEADPSDLYLAMGYRAPAESEVVQ